MTREAVRQICRVFRELCVSLVKENQSLKDTVRHLETELRSKVDTNAAADRTQTLYKIKPSGEDRDRDGQRDRRRTDRQVDIMFSFNETMKLMNFILKVCSFNFKNRKLILSQHIKD